MRAYFTASLKHGGLYCVGHRGLTMGLGTVTLFYGPSAPAGSFAGVVADFATLTYVRTNEPEAVRAWVWSFGDCAGAPCSSWLLDRQIVSMLRCGLSVRDGFTARGFRLSRLRPRSLRRSRPWLVRWGYSAAPGVFGWASSRPTRDHVIHDSLSYTRAARFGDTRSLREERLRILSPGQHARVSDLILCASQW